MRSMPNVRQYFKTSTWPYIMYYPVVVRLHSYMDVNDRFPIKAYTSQTVYKIKTIILILIYLIALIPYPPYIRMMVISVHIT